MSELKITVDNLITKLRGFNFLQKSDVVDNLTTSTNNVPLSANQGKELKTLVDGKENISNKVTSISSSSTDTQYPSAKIVYESLNNLHTSDIKIGGESLTNIWTGATITTQALLNIFINNHIGEIDARLQKEEIVYGSIYNTDSSRVYISGTYNKVCESVNSQHPLSNEMILFKLPNDLNSSSTKSIRIKIICYPNSYSSTQNSYGLNVNYNNVAVEENTFTSNTIILLKLNSNNNGFDVVGVFSPNSTGSYTDLTDKPSIPSSSSDLSDGSDLVKTSSTTGLLKNDGGVMQSGTGASNWAVGNHTHSGYVSATKVTSWQSTPSDSNVPSEKLVKDYVDGLIGSAISYIVGSGS